MPENQMVLSQPKYLTPDVHKALSTGAGWLPRIQITAGTSTVVTEAKVSVGRFVSVSGKNVTDYGTRLIMFILAWRPKVVQYEPELKIIHNVENPEFAVIRDLALRGGANNPNQFGQEFFVWLPEHDSAATFFHGSTTLRNEGPVGVAIFNKQIEEGRLIPVLDEIDVIKGRNKKTWHTGRMSEYNVAIPDDKWPQQDKLQSQLDKFNDPKDDIKEIATDAAPSTGRDG